MATGDLIADPVAWASALSDYRTARSAEEAFTNYGEPGADEALAALESAEATLLDLPAPNLAAVVDKLLVIWGDELFLDTDVTDRQCMVIGDLRRFQRAQQ